MARYTATIIGRGANEMDGWRSDEFESNRTLDELNDFGQAEGFSMHFEEVEEQQPVAADEPSAVEADDDSRPWWKVW